jgi:rifampicin phosphotransferase
MNSQTLAQIDSDEPILVRPLEQLRADDRLAVGGKGANLGELIAAGLPVPPGIVLTTAAYDQFVRHNRLDQLIRQELAGLTDPKRSMHGAEIRAAFEMAALPLDLQQAILYAYQQMGEGAVAVRSSATAEDLPGMTFAGQQESYLNISDVEALLDAVRRCWASLWTDRAIVYRQRQQIDQATVKLAVVVQRMVAAEVAGVMFTANPISGARDEIVIDANPGLGEAVVAGLVTPDHFVLDKGSQRVIMRSLGRRETIIRVRTNGGTEQVTGSQAETTVALSDGALAKLAQLGSTIEQHFGLPQDIEWVWADEAFFIVQARPMTALPDPLPPPSRRVQLQTATLAEVFAVRPYPLDLQTWMNAVSAAAFAPMLGVLGLAAPPIQEMFQQEDGVLLAFDPSVDPRPTWQVLLAPFRLMSLALRNNPVDADTDPQVVTARMRAHAIESRDLAALSWSELLTTVREVVALAQPLTGHVRRTYLPRALLAAALLRLWLSLLKQGNRFGTLLSGVESATLAANRGLEALVAHVRADASLAALFAQYEADELMSALEQEPTSRRFRAELQAFLDCYGHRDVVISTAFQPTWKDAPALVLGMIKGFAQSEASSPNGPPGWQIARDAVIVHPLLRLPPLRSAFLTVLDHARTLWVLRENSHYDLARILPGLRRALLELGRRLVLVDALDSPEMVFHLQFEELERVGALTSGRDGATWPPSPAYIAELRAKALRRQAKRIALAAKPLIDPRLYRQAEPNGAAFLHGVAGSPGVAEGTVRIIRDISEFDKLRAGEVLVAPFTNPSWTPLFQRAAAVVVDAGSVGSHAAIVAREYGIPAVMGTVDGTRRLTAGQRVRVDGSHGRVTLLA